MLSVKAAAPLRAAAAAAAVAPRRASARAMVTTAPGYTQADQVARYAAAVEANNPRVLDIDSVYEDSWLSGANVLVTGANRGIGLDLSREAAARGANVYAAVRKGSPELAAAGPAMVVEGVDVTDYASCERLASELADAGVVLDVVVNNAGYFPAGDDGITAEGGCNFEENLKQYDICAVGPLRVTAALVRAGRVKAPGGKVAMITSQGGSLEWRQVQNKDVGQDYGHHMGKAGANMAGVLMAEELRPQGIAVVNLHPGFNRTEMTRKYEHIWDIEGAVEASVGAKRVWHEVGRAALKDSGCDFINCEDGLLIPY